MNYVNFFNQFTGTLGTSVAALDGVSRTLTLAAIDKLGQRLDNAFALHKEAHACCVEHFDEATALKCCGDLTKELDQIIADHNHLMKSLAAKKPAKDSK